MRRVRYLFQFFFPEFSWFHRVERFPSLKAVLMYSHVFGFSSTKGESMLSKKKKRRKQSWGRRVPCGDWLSVNWWFHHGSRAHYGWRVGPESYGSYPGRCHGVGPLDMDSGQNPFRFRRAHPAPAPVQVHRGMEEPHLKPGNGSATPAQLGWWHGSGPGWSKFTGNLKPRSSGWRWARLRLLKEAVQSDPNSIVKGGSVLIY